MHGQPPAGPRNRLADETSPYLLQHAANPVDWHPWGAEAIALARELDRPILLSIGYSACHWCHVMAHESFEDEATAEVMNRLFVNVKLDREERPDLDKVYQLAHQLLTQRGGGWPLTMFLAPDDLTPFFGGTYFPKEPRYGMPAFTDLIERVAAFYRDEREGVRSPERGAARRVRGPRAARCRCGHRNHARTASRRPAATWPRTSTRASAASAPRRNSRMPRPSNCCCANPGPSALDGDLMTLRRMAEGGIFDQLGGGFCRYSVDPFWMIPHFEKMLYDNGPLLALLRAGGRGDGRRLPARRSARDRGLGAARDARTRTAASTPRSMRIPKATRAASTCGSARRSSACSRRTSIACSRAASGSTASRISRAPGTCTASSPWTGWPRNWGCRTREADALLASARQSSSRARSGACGPDSTTRS